MRARLTCVSRSPDAEQSASLTQAHLRAADRVTSSNLVGGVPSPRRRQHVVDRGMLHHVGFTVASMERSLQFYVEGLGLRPVYTRTIDAPWLGQAIGVSGASTLAVDLEIPGSPVILQLFQFTSGSRPRVPAGMTRLGAAHVAIVVQDIARALERLGAATGTPTGHPVTITTGAGAGARLAVVNDPDGLAVELVQAAPRR